MSGKTRIIPVLSLSRRRMVKTERFQSPRYIGDPLNIVRIFAEKEVDELVLTDISASKEGRVPDFDLLERAASEASMPLCYGGGLRTVAEARRIIYLGYEKVAVNTAAFDEPDFVARLVDTFGSQAVVASVDVERSSRGTFEVFSHAHRKVPELQPLRWVERLVKQGAGEILLNAVHKDGTLSGYDMDLLRLFAGRFDVPVIPCGGARSAEDMVVAVREGKLSALGVGARFVYEGRLRAVLPNYLSREERRAVGGAA